MYELLFPDYLSGYESETEAKGYLVDLVIVTPDATYEVTVYDTVRLAEQITDEVASDGQFAVGNLLVVPTVTREEIAGAVERLARGGFAELVSRGTP